MGVIAVVEDDFAKFNFLRAAIAVGDFLIGLLHLGVCYWVGAQDVCHQGLGGYVTFKGFPVLLEGGFAVFATGAGIGAGTLDDLFEFGAFV